MSSAVLSSLTVQRLITRVLAPAAKNARTMPTSSSPVSTAAPPVSHPLSTTVAPPARRS